MKKQLEIFNVRLKTEKKRCKNGQ